MPRLFIAIRPPEEVVDQLDALCQGLPGARWTEIDALHLTLRFVGEVDHATFYEIGENLAHITMPPFELRLRSLGQFPLRGPLRQLWVGCEPCVQLERLRRRVHRVVTEAGVATDGRKFVPHVTLARFRQPPPQPRLASYLSARNLFRSTAFAVSSYALYSSHLRAEGPLHLLEANYDFVRGLMERT